MDKIVEELKKPEVAAAAGAVATLAVSLVVPPVLLLSAGVLAIGGVYGYNWYAKRKGEKATKKDDTANAGPAKGGKDN